MVAQWSCDTGHNYYPDGDLCVAEKILACVNGTDTHAATWTADANAAASWSGTGWVAATCEIATCVE